MQVMEWSNEKYMVLNADKCHHNTQGETLKIQDFVLLGMPTLIEKKKIY